MCVVRVKDSQKRLTYTRPCTIRAIIVRNRPLQHFNAHCIRPPCSSVVQTLQYYYIVYNSVHIVIVLRCVCCRVLLFRSYVSSCCMPFKGISWLGLGFIIWALVLYFSNGLFRKISLEKCSRESLLFLVTIIYSYFVICIF